MIKEDYIKTKAIIDDWDPIGVKGLQKEMNEYDSYIPMLVKLKGDEEKLIEYLE
ncbi:MAG: hypothetical protein F6K19_37090, partial [Cyanothece sp. SIO1E1]|nr:hypothetical protein [Cyanothece sp. SIO1E1]